MPENPLSFGFNLLASPFYGLGETLSDIGVPGAEEFVNLPLFSGQDEFRGDHPGFTLGAELASYLIPAAGWAKATANGAGLLGAATRGAAGLGGANPTLRFALGETARWAPFNAALTGLDTLAGKNGSVGQSLGDFALGQGISLGLSAAGASPAFQSLLRSIPGVGRPVERAVRTVFGPTPENRVLYGMGPEIANNPALESLVSQFDPVDPPQIWGRKGIDLLRDVKAGGQPGVEEGDILNLLDYARKESLQETTGPGESYVRLPYPTEQRTRNFLNRTFSPGKNAKGTERREILVRDPKSNRDIGRIEKELQLPPGWEFLGRYFRHVSAEHEDVAKNYRANIGLRQNKRRDTGFRRVERVLTGPDGAPYHQLWTIRPETDGMWILATELPGASTSSGTTRRFLQFKTDQPDAFFPEQQWAKDIDRPDDLRPLSESVGQKAWDPIDNLPEKVGPFMDSMREIQKTIMSPENFSAMSRAAMSKGRVGGKEALLEALSGNKSVPGIKLNGFVDAYLTPTMFQLRNSPRAAQVLQMRRAVFDAAEARKQEIVYGRQSLPKDKDIWAGVFGKPDEEPGASIYSEAKQLLADPAEMEAWRKNYFEDRLPLEQWADGPAKEFQTYLRAVNDAFVEELNTTLKAIGENPLKVNPEHAGVGHNFSHKGSNHYAIFDPDNNVVAIGTGHSAEGALRDAQGWIEWRKGKGDGTDFHIGPHFTAENFAELPKHVKEAYFTPGFFLPRTNVGGYRWERESIKNLDELIQAFDLSYAQRSRHLADHVGSALTHKEHQKLLRTDPETGEILASRLNQLKGVQGALDKAQNRVLDKVLAPVLGVNSATKLVEKTNEMMHHLTFGMGNLAYPLLNVTSLFQTGLPEVATILASADDDLARLAYYLPTPGANGKPRGLTAVYHAPGSIWRGFGILKAPTDLQREVFERLSKDGDLGPRYAEEYLGQNAGRVTALREALKEGPEAAVSWAGAMSSFLPAQTEKLSRMMSAAMAMDAFEKLGKIRGQQFNQDQMFRNVQNFVRRTNYLYSTADRPAIFTTPAGTLFGGMKNWMAHYLFALADYTGLAAKGNVAPALMAMAGVGSLGGIMGLPFLGGAADWMTETFADQDLTEYLYSNMGPAANGIAYGLPAALGVSFSGATSAPGAKFAHDIQFLSSVPAFERMQNMARGVGRYWDDSFKLGIDPWQDPVFRQQMIQGYAPRSLYRFADAWNDDALTSSTTGYAMVDNLTFAEKLAQSMGFTPTRVEREYGIYERMRADNDTHKEMVSRLGEAYFLASTEGRQDDMQALLEVAAIRGVDQSSLLRSAARRSRDAGVDMFGRLRGADQSRYEEALGQ